MPDVFEGNTIPDPGLAPETDESGLSAEKGLPSAAPKKIETAYARGAGSSADVDGTQHHAAAPGEGEGTGIGESGG